jgi:hypothetical protein
VALLKRALHAVLASLLLAAGPAMPAAAAAAESLQLIEQQIQAGLIYNFLKSTKWPAEAGPDIPLVVCLFGGDPFDGHLRPMAGRTVNQHAIEIRNIRTFDETRDCALLVIHPGEKPRWPQLRTALAAKPVLTVSDFEGFAQAGGMIELTRIDQRIGIKLNTDAVAAAHLQVEDRLLRLATAVRGGVDAR